MAADNVSAMVTNTVNILRDNLHDRYDSGFPVLKELIQNANDAGASELYITKTEGISSASHPLLKKPALLVFNDGEVTDDDLKGIISVAQGGKTGKQGVIGKFGLGMKSIFHFCDMFFYIAFMGGTHKVQLVNPFIDPLQGIDPYHEKWDILTLEDSSVIEKEVIKLTGNRKAGLMLWIPLRDDTYKFKILSDIYKAENIWKQDSNELRKNVALSLAALEISTPCNGGKRTLEKVQILTQEPSIDVEFKAGTKTIISDKSAYCEILKCKPLQVKEGKAQLKALIEKDKFTKISFVDDEGNEHEIASYDENQFVSMAILKFIESSQHSLNFNWCSYLPLNSKADTCDYFEELDSEYHFIVHANFAIDSGRRNVVDYNECIDRNSVLDINTIEDDRAAQSAWNKILIRSFILPKVLEFVCAANLSDTFIHSLYSVLCDFRGLGYYCFDKGFAFKANKKWEFSKTESIQETALKLIQLMNQFQMNHDNLKNEQIYTTVIKICDYLQNNSEGINWALVNTKKAISDTDISNVSKIISNNKFPLLFLPSVYSGKKISSYKFTDVSIIINFLLCFEKDQLKDISYLSEKVGFLFEYLCEDKCLDKEACSQIYADINIQQFIPLFELSIVNDSTIKYTEIYKTYKQVYEISADNRLFSHYGNDGKNSYLQKYHRMFPEIQLYMMSGIVARNEFFLKDQGEDTFYRFEDTERPDAVRALNHKNLDSILCSMQKHLAEIKQEDFTAYSDFIRDIQTVSDEIRTKYTSTIRAVLAGREVDNSRNLFHLVGNEKEIEKALFYKEILKKVSYGLNDAAFIHPEIEVSKILFDVLKIQDVDILWFENRIGDEYSGVQTLAPEEKEKLAAYIESPEVFSKLPIHKTIDGDFVSVTNHNIEVFLENEIYRFPNGYKLPEKVKLISIIPDSHLQKDCIKTLMPENIVNIMLMDSENDLGNPNGIRNANYLKELISETKVKPESIVPNARKRRWIPEGTHYYSFDETINNTRVSQKFIDLCDNLILSKNLNTDYRSLESYFLKDDDKVLESIISHAKKTKDCAWPWFNLKEYTSLLGESNKDDVFKFLIKTEDPLFTILKEFKSEEEIISYTKQLSDDLFVSDSDIISDYKVKYLINFCSDEIENKKVEDYKKNHLVEIVSTLDTDSITSFIEKATQKVCLPSKANIWKSIDTLVNFDTDISDLGEEHTLSDSLHKYFPSNKEREGEQNSHVLPVKEFIEKISACKNKKLWGAFCYIVATPEGRISLYSHGELFELKTREALDGMRVPKLATSTIIVHDTVGNYCLSLTGKRVDLKDAADVDTVFYKAPVYDGMNLTIDLFDNFTKFSATSIETAIKDLFELFGIHSISDSFFNNLANPTQAPLNTAVNMIFNTIFSTLKVLKLEYNAGKYNQIAIAWEKYQEASGESNFEVMQQCNNSIKAYIEQNSGNIQEEIRQRVITFIGDAEYKERCILFELFQNADDAYNQLDGTPTKAPYFNVLLNADTMTIEHSGRPINQYKVGAAQVSYKADLTNMLTIGWSDKSVMKNSGRQTGKFGYGFKTVYLICDEPHVISGDYNFIIKAALYPQAATEETDYTDKTSVILKLNQNGQKCKSEIITEFQNAAQYQVLFSKKIRQINCYGASYTWSPDTRVELKDFNVEISKDFILFRTKPLFDEQACLAFRRSGNQIIAFDENAPKIWCMAPLLDLPNIGFAISASFKTNTGRQTLANENPENVNLIDRISTMFSNALVELWNIEDYKELIPSLVNVTLIGTTKSPFEPIPKKLIRKFLGLGFIPDGISKFYQYSGQELYSLSATYFNDKFQKQFDTIDEANAFIQTNSQIPMLVLTQIAADELKDLDIDSKNLGKVIGVLDKLLNYETDLEVQKDILMNFSKTAMYDFVQESPRSEKLSECRLYDADNKLKPISQIYNVSEDYDRSKSIIDVLFTPSRAAHKKHDDEVLAAAQQGLGLDIPEQGPEPEKHISFNDVYDEWKISVLHEEWDQKVKEYYSNQLYPEFLEVSELSSALACDNPSNGKMPESWTIMLLLAMTQSLTAWGHSDVTNRNAIRWLYSKDLIQKFSEGMELQKLYDEYLEVSEADESYLRHFECLLRIYKIRKDFEKFYNLLYRLPMKQNLDDITQFLVTSSDPELSGMAIKLSSSKKSLKLGISLLIRDLIRCGFWKEYFEDEDIEKLYKFAYMPKKIVLNSMIDLNDNAESQQIYNEILNQLPEDDYKQKFICDFDLPFIILGKNWS
nr:hypothetical protein [uncultured Treponema sp.]